MNSLKRSKTEANLAKAWLIESANIRWYEILAKQIKKEGYEQMAAIFLEVAEQKRSHTKTFMKFLSDSETDLNIRFRSVKSSTTLDALMTAQLNEIKEAEELFAEFEKIAWEEGFKQIATKFKLFIRIKKFYHGRFLKLAQNLEEGKVFKKDRKVKWICRKCGLIYESERALKNCPGCEHPQAYFEILAENY